MIDDSEKTQALEPGIIILTGGRIFSGSFIITIPTDKLDELASWNAERVSSLFCHLSRISKYIKSPGCDASKESQSSPVVCLADFRHAAAVAIKQVVVCLESVELQQRGTISAVYFVKPRNKTRSHVLKKLLGLKPSKKRPTVPLFKVVLMKSVQEIYSHVDVSQLTADFGGTIRYNHTSWLHLYSVVIRCVEGCHDLLTKLPGVRDKVDLLQEYETDGLTSSQVQQLLADLIDRFHIILSESSLPLYLTQCKQTLFLLDHPSSDNHLSLVHPELVSGLKLHLRGTYSELEHWSRELEEAWRVTENRLTVLIQICRHKERAREIERKICDHYHPLLREHPIVGKTLSQAELYRAHFTTTLYDPAKELLSQATEILEAVQRLKSDIASQPASNFLRRGSTNSHSGSIFSDQAISDINKCLTTSIQPFTTQLQQLQQLYVSIHVFHLLFEKALIWYKKVLKFIPESLLQRCSTESSQSTSQEMSHQTRQHLVYMPPEWLGVVRVFLSRHPPPRQEHIDRIDESIPQHVDRKMRSQARSLALRLQLLQRVLTSTRLPLKVVTAVLAWRAELFGLYQHDKALGPHHTAAPLKSVPHPTIIPIKSVPHSTTVALKSVPHHSALPLKSVPHSTAVPVKDLANSGLSTHQDTQSHDKVTGREQHKPTGNKPPEKPPRARKFSSFDHEGASKTSSHATGPNTGSESKRGSEKSPIRRNSKSMSRSKSVDFNFNSSSTDGSVFDYDKALAQAENGAVAVKMRPMPRKSRISVSDPKIRSQESLKTIQTDEKMYSDSSLLISTKRSSGNVRRDADNQFHHDENSYSSGPGSEESTQSSLQYRTEPRKQMSNSEPEPHSTASAHHKHRPLHAPHFHHQKNKNKLDFREVTTLPPSLDERFIRITLTPRQLNADKTPSFRLSSSDILGATELSKFDDKEESDNDLAQVTDPYDCVINRIKEISSSDLTNIEKLKRVSELLSRNNTKQNASPKTLAAKHSKLSYSTMDLRQTDSHPDGHRKLTLTESDFMDFNQNPDQSDSPLEAVQRMKKNLAKSMEELNISPSSLDTNNSNINHQHSVKADNQEGVRYVSELKIHPVYIKTDKASKQEADVQEDSPSHSAPDHTVLSSKIKDSLNNRSWSDVESFSQGVSASFNSSDPAVTSIRNPKPSMGSYCSKNHKNDEFSKFLTPRFIPDDSDIEFSPVDSVAPHNSRLPPIQSTNVFTNRNFISPSFLLPASSMTNLSSRRHPDIIFDIDVDLEQDYQVLEDLEVLQTMQENSLSNENSKYALKKPKRKSDDYMEEKMTVEPWDDSLHHGINLTSKQESHDTKTVPEIKVNHLSTHWSSFDSQGKTIGQYLSSSDINFDRLTREADHEYQSQEEVAESLRKTQKILEEEESRCHHRLLHPSDPSIDDDDDIDDLLGAAGGLSHATSLDNGYGSWASKLVLSTSSEGAVPDRDWRQLSSSSADSSGKSQAKAKANQAIKMSSDEDFDLEACDTVHELPCFDKPLTGSDLY